jgi:hypothetical protein
MFFGLLSYCFLICVLMVSSARAGFILNIDLSTVNQVTISATTGLSAATVSGDDHNIGVYLKDVFDAAPGKFEDGSRAGSSLVYFNATSDGFATIYGDTDTDRGLNIFHLTVVGAASFTTGVQAFTGSATWDLTPTLYASFLLAPTSGGDVYAFAYAADQLNGGPQVIGEYSVSGISAVPEPTSMAIFGLGGLGMAYLARRKRKV